MGLLIFLLKIFFFFSFVGGTFFLTFLSFLIFGIFFASYFFGIGLFIFLVLLLFSSNVLVWLSILLMGVFLYKGLRNVMTSSKVKD